MELISSTKTTTEETRGRKRFLVLLAEENNGDRKNKTEEARRAGEVIKHPLNQEGEERETTEPGSVVRSVGAAV